MKIFDKVLNDFITMKTSQQADKNSSNDKNNTINFSNYKINQIIKLIRNN